MLSPANLKLRAKINIKVLFCFVMFLVFQENVIEPDQNYHQNPSDRAFVSQMILSLPLTFDIPVMF